MKRLFLASISVATLLVTVSSPASALSEQFKVSREQVINRLDDRFEEARDTIINKLNPTFEDAYQQKLDR
ncbi:MAG: hypothetical protein Kow00121_35520 [Elainellaceae cyanobacterium]